MIRKSIKPADMLTISFGVLLAAITAVFYSRIESAVILMVIFSTMAFFQLVLVYISGMNKFLSVTRDIIFPVLCVVIFFDCLGPIVHRINPQDIDYLLIRLDYQLFGCYPTVFLEEFSPPLLIDILQVAYSTYYFTATAFGVLLKAQGKHEAFSRYLFFVLLCYYLSYIGYMLFPALGPRYAMEHLQAADITGFMVSQPIQDILNLLEGVKRDAFPSGHTAITLVVLFSAFRYDRKFAFIILVPALLLMCATVFCRYHYVVDVLGGVVLAVVSVTLGELYYRRWEGRDNGSSL
jgi:membrane-associated phospholipid phosphatase